VILRAEAERDGAAERDAAVPGRLSLRPPRVTARQILLATSWAFRMPFISGNEVSKYVLMTWRRRAWQILGSTRHRMPCKSSNEGSKCVVSFDDVAGEEQYLPGKAVQVDPMKPMLKPPGTKCLKL